VAEGQPAAGELAAGAGDERRDAGPYVVPQNQEHGGLQVQETRRGKGDDHPDGSAAALKKHGHENARDDTQDGVCSEPQEEVKKLFVSCQGLHRRRHDVETEKEHAEPEKGPTLVLVFRFPGEKENEGADEDKKERRLGQLEGNELGGDGRSDVGPEDNGQGCRQGDQARVDETDEKDGRGAGTLDDGSEPGADEHGHDAVRGDLVDEVLEKPQGEFLKGIAEEVDSVNEKAEST